MTRVQKPSVPEYSLPLKFPILRFQDQDNIEDDTASSSEASHKSSSAEPEYTPVDLEERCLTPTSIDSEDEDRDYDVCDSELPNSQLPQPPVEQESIQTKSFPRISKPVELLRTSYDCVVIGSGYGGAVAASRMARAGESVCVLERGQEKWPGEYPTTSQELAEESHFSGEFTTGSSEGSSVDGGNPTGLYHLIFGRDQNAIVGNGLGGTSLINANVFLEADERLLSMDFWPPEIRNNPHELDKYYQAVKDVLEPEPYPDHWPKLKKMEVFKRQAKVLGMGDRFYKVPQTTRFQSGPNSCGVNMSASTLTGQDAMGVNDGSKTTTLVTYLADAWNWGAEMFCECEVRYIEKVREERGGGYLIYFSWHGHNRGRFQDNVQEDLLWVHAKKAVFLGAGAIGTTEILLRSKEMGLEMSDCVGQGMSGNGDMLAFGYNTDTEVNAIGRAFPCPTNPVGPTITGVIDHRKGHENPLDGFVIQEGAIPQAFVDFLQVMMDIMPGNHQTSGTSLLGRAQEAMDRWKSRLLGPYVPTGAVEKTQVFLVMSHDGSQATLSLKNDKPVLEFAGVGRSDRVKELNALLAKATAAVGGTLVQSPFYATMGQQQITAHPLGGANMSWDNNGAHGVTNHIGQVFKGNDTIETYPGLIVTDGSLIPAAIGVNPLATIAALAERAVAHYARRNNLVISKEKNDILDLHGEPAHRPKSHMIITRQPTTKAGFSDDEERLKTVENLMREAEIFKVNRIDFAELLSGFIHKGSSSNGKADEKSTYELAFRTGRSRGQSARFFVNVALLDPDVMLNDDGSTGILTGTFVCPAIKGSPFMALRGDFGLFKPDDSATGTSRLTYECDMVGVNGRRLHFHGYKIVDSSVTLDPRQLWYSTTTLYISITESGPPKSPIKTKQLDDNGWTDMVRRKGANGTAAFENTQTVHGQRAVACGILHLRPMDLLSEVLTLTPMGNHLLEKALKVANFVSFFTLKSLSFMLAPLAPLQYPVSAYQTYANYTPPMQSYIVVANDGVRTEMHMWEPSPSAVGVDAQGNPVKIENLFMIPGASVDHQIFSLPTISFNAINYFTRAGYRVFVTVHRIGQLRSTNGQQWTTYDARLDIKACLERIRRMYGEKKIYTVAHCMGSVAFSCGLLDGTIPSDWILGVTASQVFMNPIWAPINMAKATSPIAVDSIYRTLIGNWFECSTSTQDTFMQQTMNQLLRFYPIERHELCNNAACHRTTLLFGRCWSHHNLNEATHRNIDKFFGGASMTLMSLLKRMGSRGQVSTNAPAHEELTTPRNVQRLRGIPFLLFVGGDSAVLSPEATERTYEHLCDTFGMSAGMRGGGIQYRRRVVPGYGHLDCWMGRNAWRDVFPFVREEVDRVVRGEAYRFRQPSDRFARIIESGEM
ncbi:hypothetical protein PT974_01492 [Cladobotryum mycophilum]|uniref:Cholesterol oxidase n=1 Tax=Cladobotryum mycophilum TaxID=491253 RepID=A0ABR0T3U6_9HYPO